MIDFENIPKLGVGIYTPAEIARILRLPYHKVNRWIDTYWDGKLGREFEQKYSWKTGSSKAVSFHTFVEFYVMMRFSEAGVKPAQILAAHKELAAIYETAFPFAVKEVLNGIHTDGRRIYLSSRENTISLDGTKQLNLEFIKLFFLNLDFDEDNLASRFWPMGKQKSVLIDPERKFGHPVLENRNIYPETLYNHLKAGDPIKYISMVYELSEKQVQDAIDFIEAA